MGIKENIITVKNLVKTFKDFKAVDNISFLSKNKRGYLKNTPIK